MPQFRLIAVFTIIGSLTTWSQNDSTFVDTKYLEDHLYFNITYNLMVDHPEDFSQNGISGGIALGFIKDIPLNERRNVGLGIGLGFNYNAFNHNIKFTNDNPPIIIPESDFKNNYLATYVIEAPIEFRWRTSTATKYGFWRIYTGLKLGYVVGSTNKFSDDLSSIKVSNLEEVDKFQYGLSFSAGYSTFNLHLYYGLNPLFKDTQINGQTLNLKQLNVGLIFYIL
ncbi:porin family protein [Urechidicola sp. KH5]